MFTGAVRLRPSSLSLASVSSLLLASLMLAGCQTGNGSGSGQGLSEEILRQNIVGTAYLSQQKWSDAEAQLRKAVEAEGEEPVLLINLAVALMQQARPDEAAPLLEKALTLDTSSSHAHYLSALIARNRGEIEKAAEHFDVVVQNDPRDVSALYNLASSLAQTGGNERAEQLYREAIALNPTHISSIYGLGRLLLQTGKQDEGTELINRSRELREGDAFATTMGTQYGEQGPYAMAVDFPGGGLTASETFNVAFKSETSAGTSLETSRRTVVLVASEDEVDTFFVPLDEPDRIHVVSDATSASESTAISSDRASSTIEHLLAGDVDADGTVELVALTAGPNVDLMTLDASSTPAAMQPVRSFPGGALAAATLVDRDHDGDLDIWACRTEGHCFLSDNDGKGSFGDPNEQPLQIASADAQVGFTDFDNDRDIDLLVRDGESVRVLSNLRNGSFAETTDAAGLSDVRARDLAIADLNKDGWMDIVVARGAQVVVHDNERGRFGPARTVFEGQGVVLTTTPLDMDNDGLLDIAVGNEGSLEVARNPGGKAAQDVWAHSPASSDASLHLVATADLDADGDLDLVGISDSVLRIVRNESDNPGRWVSVSPRGVRDNATGVGAKVELLSGALRQKFEVTSTLPLHIGLGDRERVDAVRLLWPGGVLQDELDLAANQSHDIKQVDRKGTSCPLLYAWGDDGWEFVTDFLGGAAIGYRHGNGSYSVPDTDEYVLIENGLTEKDGTLRVRVNNQLEEVIWFDQLELIAIDHPENTRVYPNERLMPGPPFPDFHLFASERIADVPRAMSVESGQDVTERLVARDRHYVDDFRLEAPKGYAEFHTIELDLGPIDVEQRVALLLDGWIDYADSTSNLAAAQAGLSLIPPRLSISDGRGGWNDASERMGFPAGLPKTMLVDLSGLLVQTDPRVRIGTTLRIYWDRARVMLGGEDTPLDVRRLPAQAADLRFGGFPAETSPDGRKPFDYDPNDVNEISPWKTHIGTYTAFGSVTDRVTSIDDRFVTTRNGDEIELRFNALEPAAEGMTRSYLLFADGFGKDMDPNSAANQALLPIPSHGMGDYPRRVPANRAAAETDGRVVARARDGHDGAIPLVLRVLERP